MSHGFGVDSGDCKIRHVSYNQRFKLKGGKHLLRVAQEINARHNKRAKVMEVKVEGDNVPSFWIDWDTVVEVIHSSQWKAQLHDS